MRLWIIVLMFQMQIAFAGDFSPHQIYIDKDVCPGEWCRFGIWTAGTDIPVYAEAAGTGQPIAIIRKGQKVNAITGHAYVKPQKYSYKDKAGKQVTLWVLTYLSEGYFKVWENGKIIEKELGFSPYGPDTILPYEMEWWVKFKLPDGVIGWAIAKHGFQDEGP